MFSFHLYFRAFWWQNTTKDISECVNLNLVCTCEISSIWDKYPHEQTATFFIKKKKKIICWSEVVISIHKLWSIWFIYIYMVHGSWFFSWWYLSLGLKLSPSHHKFKNAHLEIYESSRTGLLYIYKTIFYKTLLFEGG